ncbi:MAPEG family protein [Afifella pfennigii]|uniref:MAPEG family protein n=1 Tax=Afifella pfennigii TaxID=209897 RepID=UPI00047C2E62|nr:MAPEG family protein [Afifella pfennigii]
MPLSLVLLPVFVQIALTFFIAFWMGRARLGAIRRGEVRLADVTAGTALWPAKSTQIANSFRNQFELPLLFYAVVTLAVVTNKTDLFFVLLSYAFVASRLVHAFIHTGSNVLKQRFQAFIVGLFILMGMWALFAARILLGF